MTDQNNPPPCEDIIVDPKLIQSSYGTALYYPYIDVRDFGCLKSALLYWDRVRRIVPSSVLPGTNWQVEEFVDRGVLISTDPYEYCKGAETRFRQYLLPLLKHRRNYLFKTWSRRLAEEPSLANTYQIHVMKLSGELLDEWVDKKWARPFGDWVQVEPSLAGLYMTCLAAEMSERMEASPVTDRPEFAHSGEYLCFGQYPTFSNQGLSDTLLKLNIELPNPGQVAGIPNGEILRFHEKYANESRSSG
jgi:hypothetical protein